MLKKIAVTLLSNGYAQFVAVSVFLLTARFYGVEGRGIYASATAAWTFGASLLGFSIGTVLPYFVVSASDGRERFFRERLVSLVVLVLALSFFAGAAICGLHTLYPALRGKVPLSHLAAVGVSFPYYMWMGSNDLVFSSAGEIVRQNRITFFNRTAFLLASAAAIAVLHASLFSFLILYGAFNLLQMTSEIWFLARRFRVEFVVDTKFIWAVIGKGLSVHAVTIAALLNTSFSILVLTYYSRDLKDVGYFNFVAQLTSMLMLLPIVVNRYLMSEITAHGAREVWPKQKRIMLFCLLTMCAICVVAAVLIEPFCRLFKSDFVGAVTLFRMILIVVVPSAFCTLMQSQWYSSGLFKLMSITNVGVGVLSAVVTLLTVPRFHEFGAATTTIVTFSALFVINLVFYFRLDREQRGPLLTVEVAPPRT